MSLTSTEIPILNMAIADGFFNNLLIGGTPDEHHLGRLNPENYAILSPLVRAVDDTTMRGYLTTYVALKGTQLSALSAGLTSQAAIDATKYASEHAAIISEQSVLAGKIGL